MKKITKQEFDLLTEYITQKWGIQLDNTKVSLMEYRLAEVIEKFQFEDYHQLYQKAQTNHDVANHIISAISTNETSFFREAKVFEMLKIKIIPEILSKSKSPTLNIWSAACSYGQEVYTLAIIIKELNIDPQKYKVQIMGSDISNEALAYANGGVYSELEIGRGLDRMKVTKHFHADKKKFKVNDDLRSLTHFQKVNLMERFPFQKKFDLVLCRNVAIYFSTETKKKVYEQIANVMNPGGILVIGASEMLLGISERFDRQEHNGIHYYQLQF